MNFRNPLPALVFSAVLALAGCSGVKKQEEEKKPTTEKPEGTVQLLQGDDKLACEIMLAFLNRTLELDLQRDSSELGAILAEGTRLAAESMASRREYAATKSELLALAASIDRPLTDCAVHTELGKLIPDKGPLNSGFLMGLRSSLAHATRLINVNTAYDLPSFEKALGAGILLRSRTDYDLFDRKPKYLVVHGAHNGSPNRRILSREGDLPPRSRIWSIDGKPVSGMTFQEAENALNAVEDEKKKSIVVTASKPKSETQTSVTLAVGKFGKDLATFGFGSDAPEDGGMASELDINGPGIAVIHLPSFTSEQTTREFERRWQEFLNGLLRKKEDPAGLILDLRGNGGGLLEQANAVLEHFLPSGSVSGLIRGVIRPDQLDSCLTTLEGTQDEIRGKMACRHELHTALDKPQIDVGPIIVLVDRHSASASEIVAAALHDHGRAIVLGERTWGKGTYQSALDLPAPMLGRIYALNGYVYSPAGRSHQFNGFVPDIEIEDPVIQSLQAAASEKRPLRLSDYDMTDPSTALRIIGFPGHVDAPPDFQSVTVPEEHLWGPEDFRKRIAQLKERGKTLIAPRSCGTTPGQEDFREEDDCLLSWAVKYMKLLIELPPPAPGGTN